MIRCLSCRDKIAGEPYYAGRGFKDCISSGYSGRLLVTEILYISPKIKEAVSSAELDEEAIKKLARQEGMKTLREEAEAFALAGTTTKEEVLRVTPAD